MNSAITDPGIRGWISLFVISVSMLMAAMGCANVIAAETAGKVVYARGAVSAQQTGQPPRLVANNSPLEAGEVITTGPESIALLELPDTTRIVLRPNTSFAIEALQQKPGEESAVLRLLKGGLRSVTGLLSKRHPGSVKFVTSVATIGIRGTDFTARLCEGDCASETKTLNKVAQTGTLVVARVVLLTGTLNRVGADGQAHALSVGAPLYAGDVLETGAGGHAGLAFSDETRIVLAAGTRFKIEKFTYNASKPSNDSVVLRLLKGGMRTLTGLIGKRTPGKYQFATTVATIGIRGTGFDLTYPYPCDGKSAKPGLGSAVWKGRIALQESHAEIGEGKAACVDSLGGPVKELKQAPPMDAPRPDEITVPANTFAENKLEGGEPGLHVTVFDGHVILTGEQGELHLGVGENGFASLGSSPVRYTSDHPIGRTDAYFSFDPTASAEDWAGFEATGLQCAVGQ